MKNLDDHSSLYSVLHAREATQLISDKVAKGGMIPKLTTSLDALKGGVKQVHILNGTRRDTLLQEVFTNEGAGTMVIPDSK